MKILRHIHDKAAYIIVIEFKTVISKKLNSMKAPKYELLTGQILTKMSTIISKAIVKFIYFPTLKDGISNFKSETPQGPI